MLCVKEVNQGLKLVVADVGVDSMSQFKHIGQTGPGNCLHKTLPWRIQFFFTCRPVHLTKGITKDNKECHVYRESYRLCYLKALSCKLSSTRVYFVSSTNEKLLRRTGQMTVDTLIRRK